MTQMISDEELDRLIVAASPARTPRDAKPGAAAMERLGRNMAADYHLLLDEQSAQIFEIIERIMATDPHPHRVRNRILGAVSGVAAVIAAVVVGANILAPSGQAVAATPDPLSFSGTSTVAETIDAAQEALAETPGPEAPERYVRSATWSYNVDASKDDSDVVPQLSTLSWNPALSGRMVIVEGEPYDPADASANTHAEVTSSGRVSTDLEIKPGEFSTPVVDLDGASEQELSAALTAFGVPEDPTAFETMSGISLLLDQWTLTNAQESTLLELLSRTEGAEALGTTTDRLGRSVSGLRVSLPGDVGNDTVLISKVTGRIVGIERTNVVENEAYPAGAVIGYRLFDVDGVIP